MKRICFSFLCDTDIFMEVLFLSHSLWCTVMLQMLSSFNRRNIKEVQEIGMRKGNGGFCLMQLFCQIEFSVTPDKFSCASYLRGRHAIIVYSPFHVYYHSTFSI